LNHSRGDYYSLMYDLNWNFPIFLIAQKGNSLLAYNHSSVNVNPRNACFSTSIELNNVYNEITTINNHEI
jgi:glutathione peroxidase-family protein